MQMTARQAAGWVVVVGVCCALAMVEAAPLGRETARSEGPSHTCIHGEIGAGMPGPLSRAVGSRYGRKRGGSRPFTVVFHTIEDDPFRCTTEGESVTVRGVTYACTSENLWTTEKQEFFEGMLSTGGGGLPSVSEWFFNTMDVVEAVDGFQASDSQTCGSPSDFDVPDEYKASGGGAPDGVDLVVFVTFRPSAEGNLAYAGPCVQGNAGQGQPERTLFGFLNVNTHVAAEDLVPARFFFVTLIHEVTHITVFNQGLWPLFATNSFTSQGFIDTPEVVDFVQDHFACDDNSAVATLEDAGGAGTAGVHWEKDTYGDEFMTGVITTGGDAVISDLTLALYEDSGWYTITNNNAGERLLWGMEQGCGFLGSCSQWPSAINDPSLYECPPSGSLACTVGYNGLGGCPSTFSALYGCPAVANQHDCTDPDSVEDIGADRAEETSHENCADCRCFESTVSKSSNVRPYGDISCHRYTCEARTSLRLLFRFKQDDELSDGEAGHLWYRCNSGELADGSILGYSGGVLCPEERVEALCGGMTNADSQAELAKWPVMSGIQPTAGPSEGGTVVTITGSNLEFVNLVTIGKARLNIQSRTADTLIGVTTEAVDNNPGHVLLYGLDDDLPYARSWHAYNAFEIDYPSVEDLANQFAEEGLANAQEQVDKVTDFLERYWWGPTAGLVVLLAIGGYFIWRCCLKSSAPKQKKKGRARRRVQPGTTK